jgi:hypothetical protein
MVATIPLGIHSADVQIELLVNGSVLRVAQLGPDFLILDRSVDHPPGPAEIRMVVDGGEDRWPVFLRSGLSASVQRVRLGQN